jgi:AraC-like DNA-binding protein
LTHSKVSADAKQPHSMGVEIWPQRVGGFTSVPALIRQLGGDPVSILKSIGLAPDSLDGPGQSIPYIALGELLVEAAARTECPHFGLLCGRAWHLSDLGVAGEIVRNSSRVDFALRALTVHRHLDGEGDLAFLLHRGGVVDLVFAIYHPDVVGANQIYDTLMAAGYNFIRELCGASWVPSEVFFSHAKPPNVEPYRHFFKAPLRFNSEICALRFSADWMDRPVQAAEPARLRIAETQAGTAGRGDLLPQVYRTSRALLLRGRSSGDDVAQLLAMHRRTLNRRLAAQGVTFHEVLDRVRFKVARELLADTDLVMDDIAASLAYASVSPFVRSFRRWSGTTPGQWRRSAHESQSPARNM